MLWPRGGDGRIARELFAEQHRAYLATPEYGYDLRGGYFTPSDFVDNTNFLHSALAKLGFAFDPKGKIVHSPLRGGH